MKLAEPATPSLGDDDGASPCCFFGVGFRGIYGFTRVCFRVGLGLVQDCFRVD